MIELARVHSKWVKNPKGKFNKCISFTVCPGSSDPPEKILNISASENEVYTIY